MSDNIKYAPEMTDLSCMSFDKDIDILFNKALQVSKEKYFDLRILRNLN